MGDGRYYTAEQFFSVIYLTIMIIFMVISIMLYFYKGTENRGLLSAYIALAMSAVCSFIEQITISGDRGVNSTLWSAVLLLIANHLFLHFLVARRLKLKSRFTQLSYGVLLVLIVAIVLNPHLIIESYGFTNVVYSQGYMVILVIYLCLYLSYGAIMVKRRVVDGFMEGNAMITVLALLWLVPFSSYIVSSTYLNIRMKFMSFVIYFFCSICLNLISEQTIPYRISASIFSDVRELIMDYVFIVDDKGEIIFKNNRLKYSPDFRAFTLYNGHDVEGLFNGEVEQIEAYDKVLLKYIKTKNTDNSRDNNTDKNTEYIGESENTYYEYSTKAIYKDELEVGHIITLTDITLLITMIDQLKSKQVESQKVNGKLSGYKEIVYDIEKEKEIGNLLQMIAKNQEQGMEELKEEVKLLQGRVGDDFVEEITSIITKAKNSLQDVRAVVTSYMYYYDN